jgi:peroxiredoxin
MSRASVMAVYQQLGDNKFVFDRLEDLYLLKAVATSLKAFYPESDFTKGMLADIQNQERQIATLRMNQIIEEAESTLPEIALPNTKGQTVKLSSLRGKIILLDFWSSVSQTNLFENQELKQIYKTYQPKGFEIFQVSLDDRREPWIEKVESTELPWINVCDPKEGSSYAARIYNVTSIPTNYLINKNFEIVGKNLYGKELERKIKEIL